LFLFLPGIYLKKYTVESLQGNSLLQSDTYLANHFKVSIFDGSNNFIHRDRRVVKGY
jgi:hypothetical protein